MPQYTFGVYDQLPSLQFSVYRELDPLSRPALGYLSKVLVQSATQYGKVRGLTTSEYPIWGKYPLHLVILDESCITDAAYAAEAAKLDRPTILKALNKDLSLPADEKGLILTPTDMHFRTLGRITQFGFKFESDAVTYSRFRAIGAMDGILSSVLRDETPPHMLAGAMAGDPSLVEERLRTVFQGEKERGALFSLIFSDLVIAASTAND